VGTVLAASATGRARTRALDDVRALGRGFTL
jgi:hypothetical protein